MKFIFVLFLSALSLAYSSGAEACSVSGLTLTPGSNAYSFSQSDCGTGSEYVVKLEYKNSSGTVIANQTQTKTAAGSYSFPSSLSPTGSGTYSAILTVTPKNYMGQCKGSPTSCESMAQLEYEECTRQGGGQISSAGGFLAGVAMMFPSNQCQTTYNQRIQQCNSMCQGYGSDGYKAFASKSITKSYTPFYDNSTVGNIPTKTSPRNINLFPETTDVNVSTSSYGSYYIRAQIKNSSGSVIATKTSNTVAASASTVNLASQTYTVPSYGSYTVVQSLYRENGSNDTLLDTKNTSLTFTCPAMAFYSATNKDTDSSDGSVGLTSRPRLASCHGSAALSITVKNSSGTTVYSTTTTASRSTTEISTSNIPLNFGSLADGTYTVTQTLTKSGHSTQSRNDTLVVDFYDSSSITTTPVAGSPRQIQLFSESTDVSFNASSNGSYYIVAEIKNASGSLVSTKTSTTNANSGSTVSLPSQTYSAAEYGSYSVVQKLYREEGSVDTLVDSKTTNINFSCPSMSIVAADNKDTDSSDGSVGLRANPVLAKCHGQTTLSIEVKNAAGNPVHSTSSAVSSSSVDISTNPQVFDFGFLPDGTYSVTQTLSSTGHQTQTRTDSLILEYYDHSQLRTTPSTSTVRTINLFTEINDVTFDASSDGEYYVLYRVYNSNNELLATKTSTTVSNSGSNINIPSSQFVVPDYDVYSVEQELYRESGTTDNLVDSSLTQNLSFSCPTPTISSLIETDLDGQDGIHALTFRPHVAQCNDAVTLDVVIKDSSDTTVITLPTRTINSSSVELALQAEEISFNALAGGTYKVHQTVSGGSFASVVREDTLTVVCEAPTLTGLSLVDSDATDGKHGFTFNSRLSSCNSPSELSVQIKNDTNTTVFSSPIYNLSTNAVTLQSVSQKVQFDPLSPGQYTVLQELTTSQGQILTRSDSIQFTCNEFTIDWGNPASAESPQDTFIINAQLSSPDQCNGQLSSQLTVKDGQDTLYSSAEKQAYSGASIPEWQWTFDRAGLDDTTLDIALTVTNEYGHQKTINNQLEVTCPTLFTPNDFNFNKSNEKFSLRVAGGRPCNGSGTISLEMRDPSDNNQVIGSNSSTIDLSGQTTEFVYDLPVTFPQNPVGTYSIYGELTDAKGAIVPFTYFYSYESDNTNSCSIDSINPFNFGELINFTFASSNCTNSVSFRSELIIKDENGTEISNTEKLNLSPGFVDYDPSIMPTENGTYTGQLTVFAEEVAQSCTPSSCQLEADAHYDYCIEMPRNERFPRDCEAERDQYFAQCTANCQSSGGEVILHDQMTVTAQHLVYDDSSKIVTTPVGDGLTLYLFRDNVDVNVITSSYGEYTLRATIYSPTNDQLAVIEQGPTMAESESINFPENSYPVAEYGEYRIRQQLYRGLDLIDMRDDYVNLECLNPNLMGLANIDLNAIDNFINFDHVVNSAECNGSMELSLRIDNDQGTTVYQTPSNIALQASTELTQSQNSIRNVTFTVPVLQRGTYSVTTELSDSENNRYTRTDSLEIACDIFQAGLGDPALIETIDDKFDFKGHIYSADTCNGMLDVDIRIKEGENILFEAPQQSVASDQSPIDIDHSFELPLDGATVDVIMTVENVFGDVEMFTQQVEINCPAKFIFTGFNFEQSSRIFSFTMDDLRQCNGVGTLEYQVFDLTDNNKVINNTSTNIDLTGTTNQFSYRTRLDLPADDIVGDYKVVGSVTDSRGFTKPFEYQFSMICPPWAMQQSLPSILQIDDEPGAVSVDFTALKGDVCHTTFNPNNASIEITDRGSGQAYTMTSATISDTSGQADAVEVTFTSQIDSLEFFGKEHDFTIFIEEDTGTLDPSEYHGAIQVACPIYGLDLTADFSLYGRHRTTVNRNSFLACQDELTVSWQGTHYDSEADEFRTVATSEGIPKSTDNIFESDIIWSPDAKNLGGKRIVMEPYIEFFSPYNITRQSDNLSKEYVLPCQPATMTRIHSVEQSRSSNELTFKATYTPSMTCNGHTSIIATIKDSAGNEIASTTSYINSIDEVDVDFKTQYIPQGSYTAEFNLYDSSGNNSTNEIPLTTPCSSPGVVGAYRGELSKSVAQYLMIDVPSCSGEAHTLDVTFQNPITAQTQTLTANRVNTDDQDDFFIAELSDFGIVGLHEIEFDISSSSIAFQESARIRFYPPAESTPMLNQVPYNEGAPIQSVTGFEHVTVKFDSNFSLAQRLGVTGYTPQYPVSNEVELFNLDDNSQTGSIDLTFTLYDTVHKDTPVDLTLYLDSSIDESTYKMDCRKIVNIGNMAQLKAADYHYSEPSDALLNSFRCMALLGTEAATYTINKIVVRRNGGMTNEMDLPSSLNTYETVNAGDIVPSTIANMVAITNQESNKSYGALLVKHRSLLKPVPVTPMPSGTYTAHFNPLLDYDVEQPSHSITFEYEQPVGELSLKIPTGIALEVDAAIPNSNTATYTQINSNLEVEVEISQVSGTGQYTFNGIQASGTPIKTTVSKNSYLDPTFKLLVKSLGEPETATFRIEPLTTTVIQPIDLTVSPMVTTFELANVRDQYFIGDPTVKIYSEPAPGSDCRYIAGGSLSLNASYDVPTCAFRWNVEPDGSLRTASSGSVLRGQFSQTTTSVPYDFGIAYTSPDDNVTRFYVLETSSFVPNLVPPGQITITPRRSNAVSRLGEGYYTYVGQYMPASIDVIADVPGLDITYNLDGDEQTENSNSNTDRFRIFTETDRVYESVPFSVEASYQEHSTGSNNLQISFLSVPSGLTPLIEQPEPTITGESVQLVARLKYYTQNGEQPFDTLKSGHWDVQLFEMEGRNSQPVGNPVPLGEDGTATFSVTEYDPGVKRYFFEATAKPPQGVEFSMKLSSRPVRLMVADGSAITGKLTSTAPAGSIPFAGTLIYAPDNFRRAYDLARIDWYRSNDGINYQLMPESSDRNLSYEISASGDTYYKAVSFNKHSGEQFETQPIVIKGYKVPIIQVTGDTTTFIEHPGTLVAQTLNGIDTEFEWEYRWGRYGEVSTFTGNTLSLDANTAGVYFIKLNAREVGAPTEDPYANVTRFITMTVTLPGVSRPSIVLDRSMELDTVQNIHFIQPSLIGGSNSTLNVVSEAILPSGQTIQMDQDTTVPFTPTVEHLESGKLKFTYRAWVEGFKEQTLTTYLRYAYGWEYAWPEWQISANKTEAEAPARLRFRINQLRFSEAHHSLGGEPINVQWNTSGGEVAYQYDKRFDVLYPQPGVFVTSATISDTRGNTTTVELPGIELLEGPPLAVNLTAGNSLSDWVSPTYIQANTVTESISAYDRIKTYKYYLNGIEQQGSSKRVNLMVENSGTHELKVQAITDNGEIAEETVFFETSQNQPPACELRSESENDSYYKFMALCTDQDSYIDSFEWTVDGELITGSSYWIGIDSTLATEVQNVSVKVTDTKGGVTTHEWTR